MSIRIDDIKIDMEEAQNFARNCKIKMDANESAFFLRELEYIKKISYDKKYKQLKALDILPISTEADPGAASITWSQYTKVGMAKIIANYADDAPRVDIYGVQNTSKVYRIGDSFGYDKDELRASQMANKRLDQRRAETAKRASDEKINSIALIGDANHNIPGFIYYPGITATTIPNDGTGSSKAWSAKTPDQIIRDLTNMISAVFETTNGIEQINTILMPIKQYLYIKNTKMSTTGNLTILQFFLQNNPEIMIDWLTELTGAGISIAPTGYDRMIGFVRDPMHLTLEITLPYTQLPPQEDGYGFNIFTEQKTAGVIVYYPLSICYGDGI